MVRSYLTRSFDARIQANEGRIMGLHARAAAGASEVTLARQRAEHDLADLHRARADRLQGLERLSITRPGAPPDQRPGIPAEPGAASRTRAADG